MKNLIIYTGGTIGMQHDKKDFSSFDWQSE